MTADQLQLTGQEIKDFRKKNGISQQDLATMLGVSLPTVKRWENEKNIPTDRHLLALVSLIGASAGTIAGASTLGSSLAFGSSLALGPALAMGPLGPLLLGLAALAGVAISGVGSKSAEVPTDRPTHEQIAQQLWRVLEQVSFNFPIARTAEQRTAAERVPMQVDMDRVLFDKFHEEASVRGVTPSRLIESILWLLLDMPPLSFQKDVSSRT